MTPKASRVKVACVQNSATDDQDANITRVTDLVRQAHAQGAELICMPEFFAYLARRDTDYITGGYVEEEHPVLSHFQTEAKALGTWMLLGSLAVRAGTDKVNNRSYLLRPDGTIAATYNKIHLFDVNLSDRESYRESSTVAPGDALGLAETPWGKVGMTVCYDVRFAYLYRALAQAGAGIITVPAAFTRKTGEAHWHVLLRARAIETGCYIVAPGQCGIRPWGRATFGHSLIVDPWGTILADAGPNEGIAIAELDLDRIETVRQQIPALLHDRPFR
ncbi:MAG: carbon-nitrogen hydrolase family protein [Gammaproteobacteria bacterium]|nr:carbon-nitrogen hydrolase family protein [Gammaproteobacteria bacterium]